MERARALVVIGASAGGIEPLSELVRNLPADLPSALAVVVHTPAERESLIHKVIGRRAVLKTMQAQDNLPIREGNVYVAPPDYHLWIHDGRLRLLYGPRENGLRPAIDPTFRSAASAYGARCVGVILSGMHDDGVAGLRFIKNSGGATIVQDPAEAAFANLPQRAIEDVPVDHVCRIQDMAPLIVRLAQDRSKPMPTKRRPDPRGKEHGIEGEEGEVAREKASFEEGGDAAIATALTCPDCGGTIWEFDDQSVLQFRCHVGHVYSTDSFVDAQAKTVEVALWTALRALEEKVMLLNRLATRTGEKGAKISSRHFEKAAKAVDEKIAVIRRAITASAPAPAATEAEEPVAGEAKD